MAISFVQSDEASGSATSVILTLTGATAGNTVLLLARWADPANLNSITSSGETVTLKTNPLQDAFGINYTFAIVNALAGGGSKNFQANVSSSVSLALFGIELSGCAASPFDVEETDAGTSSTATATITTTADNDFIYCAVVGDGGQSTVPSTYTGVNLVNLVSNDHGAYKVDVGAAGLKTLSWGVTHSNWRTFAIALKQAVGGGAETTFVPRSSMKVWTYK